MKEGDSIRLNGTEFAGIIDYVGEEGVGVHLMVHPDDLVFNPSKTRDMEEEEDEEGV